jgi:hypothetical protein
MTSDFGASTGSDEAAVAADTVAVAYSALATSVVSCSQCLRNVFLRCH